MAKIVFLGDDPDLIYLAKRTLEKEGYKVVEARSGENLEKLGEEKPDLVLWHLSMPLRLEEIKKAVKLFL